LADLEDLGTPPLFAEVLRVGYGVVRLGLASDIDVHPAVALAAARVEDSVVALQEAIDLAAELRQEGARQPLSVVPPPEVERDGENALLIWSRHAELHSGIEALVEASAAHQLPGGASEDYQEVLTRASRALVAIEEQRRLAASGQGPLGPEPPDPSVLRRPRHARLDAGIGEPPRRGLAGEQGDGDGPPAALRAAGLGRAATDAGAEQEPTPSLGELEQRVAALRHGVTMGEPWLPAEADPIPRRPLDGRRL
jgi:hypothetical protein